MAKSKRITDMTQGSPLAHIITFTMPLLVGNLFQQFYNLVDSIVVGNYVGADALAAVGTCGSLGFLFFSLSSGLAVGIGILAAQYFGARDTEKIKKYSGDLESPNARSRDATPLYSATATMPRLVTRR